jgi:hypothetical protein
MRKACSVINLSFLADNKHSSSHYVSLYILQIHPPDNIVIRSDADHILHLHCSGVNMWLQLRITQNSAGTVCGGGLHHSLVNFECMQSEAEQ